MTREFSIIREMARREVEQHAKRFIGIVVTEPRFTTADDNGLTEWVCDIRVGVEGGWAVITNVLIAQWALGVVTDINIPVLCERSEAGRVTVVARSEVALPDIRLDTYTYEELRFNFMRNLEILADGSVVDGFGYEFAGPGHVQVDDLDIEPEEQDDVVVPGLSTKDGPKNIRPVFRNELIEWGSTDFEYGITPFGARHQYWIGVRQPRFEVQLPELEA